MSGYSTGWNEDADPGDEDDGVDVGFTMDPEFAAALNDEPVCPRGHAAIVREADGALWCHACQSVFYSDFAGLIYPRPTTPPDEKAA